MSRKAWAGLLLVGAAIALWLQGRLRTYEVAGESMLPTLEPGDWLLIDTGGQAAPGTLVVAVRPDRPEIDVVKRVARVEADGALFLLGDAPEASTDSRRFGPVPPTLVRGVVRWRYWPLGRLGPVRGSQAR